MSDIEIAGAAAAQSIGARGYHGFACGEPMSKPGLPRMPAADMIHIDDYGPFQALF